MCLRSLQLTMKVFNADHENSRSASVAVLGDAISAHF
jgi:hypothetical protein